MKTPECDKLLAVHDKSLLLTEFVDWLRENDYTIFQKNPTVAEETMDALKGKEQEFVIYPEYIPLPKALRGIIRGLLWHRFEEGRGRTESYARRNQGKE